MNRAAALNLTGVLCLLWLGACASTPQTASKQPETPAAKTPGGVALDAGADTVAKDLPATLDGEIQRAQLLRSKGDLEDAARSLAQLMLVAPDDARVVGEYGKVLAQQGHPRDAASFLQRAIQLQPKNWTFYSALGVAYDQADEHAQAKLAYEHALSLSPGEPVVLNNMAVSHMLASDWSGARRLLAEASSRGAANPKIANNLDMVASLSGTHAMAKPAPAAPTAVASAPAKATREAIAPPRPLNPAVVMQTPPTDPKAGPVKPKTAQAHRLASSTKPKHVAHNPPPPPPALRTAAETN